MSDIVDRLGSLAEARRGHPDGGLVTRVCLKAKAEIERLREERDYICQLVDVDRRDLAKAIADRDRLQAQITATTDLIISEREGREG